MRTVTLQPGFVLSDFTDLLATRRFAYVDCYTFFVKNGQEIRSCTAQREVEIFNPVSGEVVPQFYAVDGIKMDGLKAVASIGTEVDEQDLAINFDPDARYMGQDLAYAMRMGRFDGATVRRDRYFAEDWSTPWIGGVPMFVGDTATLDRLGRSSAVMKVRSANALLDQTMPKNLFQTQCVHIIFDPGCTLDKALYATDGLVGPGATSTIIPWAGGTSEFDGGSVNIEDNGGVLLIRTIKEYVGGALVLYEPLDSAPVEDAIFVAFPGCNRTRDRCIALGNEDNWRAFPYVPTPEAAI